MIYLLFPNTGPIFYQTKFSLYPFNTFIGNVLTAVRKKNVKRMVKWIANPSVWNRKVQTNSICLNKEKVVPFSLSLPLSPNWWVNPFHSTGFSRLKFLSYKRISFVPQWHSQAPPKRGEEAGRKERWKSRGYTMWRYEKIFREFLERNERGL